MAAKPLPCPIFIVPAERVPFGSPGACVAADLVYIHELRARNGCHTMGSVSIGGGRVITVVLERI